MDTLDTDNVDNDDLLNNIGTENEEEDEEEEKTVAEILEEIENSWISEKFSPELLQHKSEYIDGLIHNISCMEKNIESLPKGDIRINIHKMEINRIKYLMRSYLRSRLEKIESNAIELIKEDVKRDEDDRLLTDGELKYADDWVLNVKQLLNNMVLKHLPSNFKELEIDKFFNKPNLDKYVFIKVLKDIDNIIVSSFSDEEISMTAGSIYVVQYKAVEHLLKDSSVKLI